MSNERSELETRECSKEVAGSETQVVELGGDHAFHELADGRYDQR